MSAANWLSRSAYLFLLTAVSPALAQQGLHWEQDLEQAKQIAAQSNRLVLVHLGAPWCAPCRTLEQQVFSQPGFGQPLAASFVAVKLNVDHHQQVARQYGVQSVPTDLIITPQGQLIHQLHSPATAELYVTAMNRIAEGYQATSQSLVAANQPATVAQSVANNATVRTDSNPTAPSSMPALSDNRYADYFNGRQQAQRSTSMSTYQDSAAGAISATTQQQPATPVQANVAANLNMTGNPPHFNDALPPYAQQNSGPSPSGAAIQPPAAGPGIAAQQPVVHTEARAELVAQLPPGSPPLALDGFCPVTLSEERAWAEGDPRWGAIHRGYTYLFTSFQFQQQFLADPDKYSPVISGIDPVLATERGQSVAGRREHGVFYGKRIYLFASEESLAQFSRNPSHYATVIRQAMLSQTTSR